MFNHSLNFNIIANVVFKRRLSTHEAGLHGNGDECASAAGDLKSYRRVAQLLAPLSTRATTSEWDSNHPPLPLRGATGSHTLHHCVDIELRNVGCSLLPTPSTQINSVLKDK